MVSPDEQAKLAAWPRFLLWIVVGAVVGLVTLIFVTLALWLPLVVGVLAAARTGARTALGGLLSGLALPLAYMGSWVGAVDRTCNSGSIDSNGVETCTEWVPAGSIRWPWFVAAGVLLVIGVALQWWARRSARRALQDQELAPVAGLSPA
jgi:hypothetical protein